MSAILGVALTHRDRVPTEVDVHYCDRPFDAAVAVSTATFVVCSWDDKAAVHRLSLYSDTGAKVGALTWSGYGGPVTQTGDHQFRLRPVANGVFAVFYAIPHALSSTYGPFVRVWLVDWSTAGAPVVGTPWTYNATDYSSSPWSTIDYNCLAASPTHVLLWGNNLTDGASVNTGFYQTLQVSGTTLSSGGTVNPFTGLARSGVVRHAAWLDSTYFVVAQGSGNTEASAKTLELVSASGASVTAPGRVSVSGSDATSIWQGTDGGQGAGFVLRTGTSDSYVVPAHSGTTASYVSTSISTATGSDTQASAGVLVGGQHAVLLDGISVTSSVVVAPVPQPVDVAAPPPTPSSPAPSGLPGGWPTVLFTDYFDGTSVDTSKWNVRTDTQSNHSGRNFAKTCTVANGYLSIRSGTDNDIDPVAHPWVSGYLDTKGKFSARYFRAEIRARIPWGSTAWGFWPAYWLRPDDGGLGEIDVFEGWPKHNDLHMTLWRDYTGTPHVESSHLGTPGFDPTQWHVYAVEKEAGSMKFYVDDALQWDATSSASWRSEAFDRAVNWHLRVQLQIGGSYGGNPTGSTVLSQTYDVDYVRVLGR